MQIARKSCLAYVLRFIKYSSQLTILWCSVKKIGLENLFTSMIECRGAISIPLSLSLFTHFPLPLQRSNFKAKASNVASLQESAPPCDDVSRDYEHGKRAPFFQVSIIIGSSTTVTNYIKSLIRNRHNHRWTQKEDHQIHRP